MYAAVLLVLLAVQDGNPKAEKPWERKVQLPVPVPMELPAVAPTNPFFSPVDQPPAPRQTPMREDFPVTVAASFAAYVDKTGTCRRAHPISNPFPGVLEPVAQALLETEFTPAKAFGQPAAVWVDVGAELRGEAKQGRIVGLLAVPPDAGETPQLEGTPLPPPDARDPQLPNTDLEKLSTLPVPKRFSAKVPAQEFRQSFKLLVEVGPDGKVKRVVFLACPEGLRSWLLASTASWHFTPAYTKGTPTTAWIVLSGALEAKVGTLRGETLRVSRTSSYPAK